MAVKDFKKQFSPTWSPLYVKDDQEEIWLNNLIMKCLIHSAHNKEVLQVF